MMQGTINSQSKQVYIEDTNLVALKGWNIYIRQPYKGFRGYKVSISGLHTLADAIRKGAPAPAKPCCDCSCHSQGQ